MDEKAEKEKEYRNCCKCKYYFANFRGDPKEKKKHCGMCDFEDKKQFVPFKEGERMKYYLAVVAVPDDYKPDGELINDVDFYFREGQGYSAIESTNMVEIRKEDYDKWLMFQQTI